MFRSFRPFVPVVLGAISTASWLYASFIGVSRLIATMMSFTDFIALYGVLLTGAIGVALVFVRPRVARLLIAVPNPRPREDEPVAGTGIDVAASFTGKRLAACSRITLPT